MSDRLPPDRRHPMVELAVAVGDEETLDELLGATLLASGDSGRVRPEGVSEFVGDNIHDDVVRLVLSRLVRAGAAERMRGEQRTAFRLDNGRVIQSFSVARSVLLARDQLHSHATDVEFVCTLPANDPAFELKDPVDFGFGQITSRLLALCGRASDSLIVFGPFLETGGIEWLLPGLEGALRSGVEVAVVSRELEKSGGKFAALRPLVEAEDEHPGHLEIYDYYADANGLERPLYTLHSKLVIVDGEAAYVGSANFTTYGFDEYFEVGVIVEGESVADLFDLCGFLVSNSAVRVH